MRLSSRITVALSLLAVIAVAPPAPAAPTEDSRSLSGVTATFEGEALDLSQGWGDAQACLVSHDGVECFRTITELAGREQVLAADALRAGSGAASATCTTPLRLYDGTYRTGTVLSIAARGLWLNLSLYGFDNRTSSYQVGSCNVELASSINGGGARYWRCLNAYCIENVMASGWNNVIFSVYNK